MTDRNPDDLDFGFHEEHPEDYETDDPYDVWDDEEPEEDNDDG